MQDLGLLNGAKRLVQINAGLKPEEKALIVCDTDNIPIAKALAYAIKCTGAEFTIAIMEPRSTHGENPTDAIAKAMLGVDVVFAPTKYSLSHSQAREEANEKGVRFISMPDYTLDMMKGGALEADFLSIYEEVKKLQQILTDANEIHIETKKGTRLDLRADGRIGNEVSGVCRTPGTWGSPPNIEVNVSPIETKTQGIIYVDGSVPCQELGLLSETMVLTIKDGKIVDFGDTQSGHIFSQVLNGEKEPYNLVVAEFGIGMNDKAVLKGSMLEDEGARGTIHFGIGHNADQGGENVATRHIDCVLKDATVTIDGVVVIKDGKFQF